MPIEPGRRTYMTRSELVQEWQFTYDRHGGRVSRAAPLFGTTSSALVRRLYRMKAAGFQVRFIDDSDKRR